jgi:hypothetical protein
MLGPEVVLRFRSADGGEPLYVGATSDADLARAVAARLVAEADAAAETAAADDETLGGLFQAEADRLRRILSVLSVGSLRLVPEPQ